MVQTLTNPLRKKLACSEMLRRALRLERPTQRKMSSSVHHAKKDGRVNWIHLAQKREKWQAVLNTVIILWVPQNVGNIWSICGITNFFFEGLYGVSCLSQSTMYLEHP
jgi:hypothetical protein